MATHSSSTFILRCAIQFTGILSPRIQNKDGMLTVYQHGELPPVLLADGSQWVNDAYIGELVDELVMLVGPRRRPMGEFE